MNIGKTPLTKNGRCPLNVCHRVDLLRSIACKSKGVWEGSTQKNKRFRQISARTQKEKRKREKEKKEEKRGV